MKGNYVQTRGAINGQPAVLARDPSGRIVMLAIRGSQGTIVLINAIPGGLDDGQVEDIVDHLVPVTAPAG